MSLRSSEDVFYPLRPIGFRTALGVAYRRTPCTVPFTEPKFHAPPRLNPVRPESRPKSHTNTAISRGSSALQWRNLREAFLTLIYLSELPTKEFSTSLCHWGAVTARGTTSTIRTPSWIALFTTCRTSMVGGKAYTTSPCHCPHTGQSYCDQSGIENVHSL